MRQRLRGNVLLSISHEKEELPSSNWVIFMESRAFQLILLISLFYALVFDDYAVIICDINTNYIFDGVTMFVILVFIAEIVISCLFIIEYFGSYYFYLDLMSMLSMFIDLVLVKVALNNSG